jgi:hypothetical protein
MNCTHVRGEVSPLRRELAWVVAQLTDRDLHAAHGITESVLYHQRTNQPIWFRARSGSRRESPARVLRNNRVATRRPSAACVGVLVAPRVSPLGRGDALTPILHTRSVIGPRSESALLVEASLARCTEELNVANTGSYRTLDQPVQQERSDT